MSIPKIIHYCWFGKKPLTSLAKKCIKSWKKYCPDYEIIRWDETNFDVSKHPYMLEAYRLKRWAFVTDIARLMIVYENGGIYLDTDVELIKPFDPFMDYVGFMGYEKKRIATGLGFGSEPKHPFIKLILDGYNDVHFLKEDGEMDLLACPERNTVELMKIGLLGDGTYQVIDGFHFLPEEYLCPMNWVNHEITNMTENTVSIHHYDASWRKWYDTVIDSKKTKSFMQKIKYKLARMMKNSGTDDGFNNVK